MTGGGKQGQLGQGRAVESCTEPKVVHLAGGTVQKVSLASHQSTTYECLCVSCRLMSRSLRSSHSSYSRAPLPKSYGCDQPCDWVNGILVHPLFLLLSVSFCYDVFWDKNNSVTC